jgi:GT2 family glycosyltransferase
VTWLHVTSVLYGNDEAATARLVSSTAHSVARARAAGLVDKATYVVGDSSPEPALSDERLGALVERAGGDDVELSYEFYDANLGSAEGNNRLMRDVDADFFLMVNPDVYAAPDLVASLLRRFDTEDVGIAEARQVPFEHPKAHDPETGVTGWASMACAMLRGETFRAVGELDSATFFLYCDDVDYSWRTRLAGWTCRHVPGAVAFHDKRLSAAGHVAASAAEEYYAAEAALFLTYKYSRPDLTETLLARFRRGTDAHRKAREEFLHRREAGTLPTPIDPDHRVAEFVEGNYARHRF